MSVTNNDQQRKPTWYFRDYITSFRASEAHCFILYGDVGGYAYESLSQRAFLLAALSGRCEVVVVYNRAAGVSLASPSMEETALKFLGMDTEEAAQDDPYDVSRLLAASRGAPPPKQEESGLPRAQRPQDALNLLERLLRSKEAFGKVAVVLDYADTICPPADKSTMPPDALDLLVTLQLWGTDSSLGRQNNPIFLITRQLSDIHPDLRASGSGYKAIEISLPDSAERLEYLQWYLEQREKKKKPIRLIDLTIEEMAQLTAGLNLRHLEDILLLGAKANGVTRSLLKGQKDAIIATQFSEVAEMIEPLPQGFAALGGMDRLITWSKAEMITPLRAGRAVDAAKGVLLVGPPGTGKTFFVRALSYELGFNAVALRAENVLGGIVGESERKLKQFFNFARALAPVAIFVDELDQSDMSRRGTGSGNPVAANLFNAMLQFMSDETLRGKVVVIFASNRPDLIDPALLRFGRVDAIIPVLLPDEDARREIVLAQARSQRCEIDEDAVTLLSVQTEKYSAAD